ncbi:hypothetical protein [Microbacterium sp. MRS-1]|uniref:hypothetical protein n=1 Tax=Microbacterium sp. MRS-1 TaxID=1451261 RepID=UPI000447E85B|nr:hypothetical protein [Microbacterium sp. MRS-1]EXJ50769.1 hypothetical protein AS96_13090 [Microbacterium sp. MRS-1]
MTAVELAEDENLELILALADIAVASRSGHELLDEHGRVVASAPERCGCRVAIPGHVDGLGDVHPLARGNVIRTVRGRRQHFIELDATWGELAAVLIDPLLIAPSTFSVDPDRVLQRLQERRGGVR